MTDASRVPLGRRAWLGDGVRGATVAADATIDWFCPAGVAGDPALWRLLDPVGGRGKGRSGPGALRCRPFPATRNPAVPAGHQPRRDSPARPGRPGGVGRRPSALGGSRAARHRRLFHRTDRSAGQSPGGPGRDRDRGCPPGPARHRPARSGRGGDPRGRPRGDQGAGRVPARARDARLHPPTGYPHPSDRRGDRRHDRTPGCCVERRCRQTPEREQPAGLAELDSADRLRGPLPPLCGAGPARGAGAHRAGGRPPLRRHHLTAEAERRRTHERRPLRLVA